jgi:hypothetical protein
MIKSKKMNWVEHVVHMGEMINVYKIMIGKSEVKILLERPWCRWKNNTKTDLKETV